MFVYEPFFELLTHIYFYFISLSLSVHFILPSIVAQDQDIRVGMLLLLADFLLPVFLCSSS